MAEHAPIHVLVVEDDADTRANLCDILELDGYRVETAGTLTESLRRDNWSDFSAIILDRKLPDGTAEELLPRLQQLAPDAAVIVATGYADLDGAIAAIRNGAADYILKPINADVLRARLARVVERRRLALEKVQAEHRQATQYDVTRILAESASIAEAAPKLLHVLCDYLGCDLCEWWGVDPDSQQLRLDSVHYAPSLDGHQFEAVSRSMTFTPGNGLPGHVWASRRPVWISDVAADHNFLRASLAGEIGLHGAVAVPICRGHEVAAVMVFYSRTVGRPDDELGQMLESFCSQIGDFLDRKLAEQSLRESEERFRHLVEAAGCMIVILRSDHTIAYFSPFAEELTGYAAEEVMGKDYLPIFLPEACRQPVAEDIRRLLSGGTPTQGFENPVVCKDGTTRTVLWNARAMPDYEGRPAILAVGQDITNLKDAQERILQSERLAAIGQMMAGLAHESRNALQRSQACLEMLALDVQDRPEAMEMVQDIQRAQDYLHHLYEEVRGYASPVHLRRKPCHLGELLDEVWLHLAVAREGRKAHLNQEENGLDLRCEIDSVSIGQVFRNILENALSACPDPVEVRAKWFEADLNGQPAVLVWLRDNGPGLTPEARRKIFEPFYTTKTQGTGLGMAIAKRIVEAHGGQIEVGSDSVRGAEILIRLPRSTI